MKRKGLHTTLHTLHCTLCIAHCALHTVHCTLHCTAQIINYLLLKESEGLIYNPDLWEGFRILGLCFGKSRVVVAVLRYRRISVATPNLPWRQTRTLIFKTSQELRMLSSVTLNCQVTMQLPWIQVLNRGTQQIIQSVQAWFSQLGERQEDLSILKIPPAMDTEDRSLEELKDAALEMVGK